jgi:hypothetical protein
MCQVGIITSGHGTFNSVSLMLFNNNQGLPTFPIFFLLFVVSV